MVQEFGICYVVVATITNIFLILSGIPSIRKVRKTSDYSSFNPYPYVTFFGVYLLWVLYNFFAQDYFKYSSFLIPINILGCIGCFFYVLFFIKHKFSFRNRIVKFTICYLIILFGMISIFLFIPIFNNNRVKYFGTLVMYANLLFTFTPLMFFGDLLKRKNLHGYNHHLLISSIFGFPLNGVFAYLSNEKYSTWAYFMGCIGPIISLFFCLFMIYYVIPKSFQDFRSKIQMAVNTTPNIDDEFTKDGAMP